MTDCTKCFAYCNNGCAVLTENLCSKGKTCSFFKTSQQIAEEEARTTARLEKMGILKLVNDKYNR